MACHAPTYPPPLSAEEAIHRFILREGFKIELFAAEPYVRDPVEMVFDEYGDAYVVEMPDYPFKPGAKDAKGRIRLLKDNDQDGRIDEAITFAENISEATSILPWKGGLLVTAAPHILYLKDTTGDHRADIKEMLFSGFFENNSEAQITNLRFNIDNWIYAGNFGQAGQISYKETPQAEPLVINGGDFRFRLDRTQYEVAAGPTQFGQALDDWGNRFVTQNTLHLQQVMIPWRYLHRHRQLPSTAALLNISDHDLTMYQHTAAPYWREERTRRRQQQYYEQGLDRIEYAANNFTGASGSTVYQGDAFPPDFYGNIFTGDVAGNLIHRDVMLTQENTPAFVAQRDEREKTREFLVSLDTWFRPTNFTVGPDGFLYVMDMYRQHIETPLSIPEDLKADMDFEAGKMMGRIYRIMPAEVSPKADRPILATQNSQELVAHLSHPNGWYRFNAQRLLMERQDISIVPQLEALLTHPKAQTRLHALYCLEGLSSLSVEIIGRLLGDTHPAIRTHAIRLAEVHSDLLPQLVGLFPDSSAQVEFQLSLTLGAFDRPSAISVLSKLLQKHIGNPWFRKAVLSSLAGSSMELIKQLEKDRFFQRPSADKQSFLSDISFIAAHRPEQYSELIKFFRQSSVLQDSGYKKAFVAASLKSIKKQGEGFIAPTDFQGFSEGWLSEEKGGADLEALISF